MALSEHAAETYRSLITVSVEGLKAFLLINGGALVAVLAFLGQSPQGACIASQAWLPLSSFVAGVALSAISFCGSYATQLALYNEDVRPTTYKGPSHTTYLNVTAVVVGLSVVAFIVGAFSALSLLSSHGCNG